MIKNIWPTKQMKELEFRFKDLGKFINSVGINFGKNLDLYIKH